MTNEDRDFYRPRPPMSKQDKLEEIRKMKAELNGEPAKESNTRD
jgi:hypothetical protein